MPQPNPLAALVLACTLCGQAALARSQQAPGVQPAVEVTTVAQLPAGIRESLAGAFGEVSDRGGRFNPGCVVVRGIPRHRLVRASLAGDHAVVQVEHGGIAYNVDTLEYQSTNGRWELVHYGDGPVPAPAPAAKQTPPAPGK